MKMEVHHLKTVMGKNREVWVYSEDTSASFVLQASAGIFVCM